MDDDDKMLWMFKQVQGEVTGSGYLEVTNAGGWDEGEAAVHLMKDGNICWSKTKTELVFDYLTKDL